MKANVFSIFLLSFSIFRTVISENDTAQLTACDVISKVETESDLATKGAMIEAIFILQNKKNSLVKNLRRVKIALLEVDHLIKDLVYERQILFDHFYRNKMQQNGSNMIDRILVDLSVFYSEILNINLIKGIYPHYLNQLQHFVEDIDNTIERLVGGAGLITASDLKMKVDKFDNILDIIEKEELFLKLVLEIENLKLSCKKYKDRINSRYSQLKLYQDGVKDKEDFHFIEHKELISSSIKRLKKNMSKLINDLENKKDKVKSVKQSLNRYYDQYRVCSGPKLCSNSGIPLNSNRSKLILAKAGPSLNWFMEMVDEIRKKLNKNFNIEDLE